MLEQSSRIEQATTLTIKMRHFESFLTPKLDEFLAYRKGLGYSLKTLKYHLLVFDRYLKEKNADWHGLKTGFFLGMRSNLPNEACSVNRILNTTHKFFQSLIRQGCIDENPLRDIPILRENTVVPFIFSLEQTEQLLGAVLKNMRQTKGVVFERFCLVRGCFVFGPMRNENIRAAKTPKTPLPS